MEHRPPGWPSTLWVICLELPLGGGLGNCSGFSVNGCGLAFELAPTSTGFSNRIIHNYNLGTESPSKLRIGSGGVLYAATLFGGLKACDQNLERCGTLY
jgi:hypothetical protein